MSDCTPKTSVGVRASGASPVVRDGRYEVRGGGDVDVCLVDRVTGEEEENDVEDSV